MGKAKASLIRISYIIHLLLVLPGIVHGQLGFMNIDCGKPRGYSGTDSITGLLYESDYEYIDTGVAKNISSTVQGPNYSSQENDLRSFPNGIRNCYSLTPVSPGKKYLLRASFLYGNYDGQSYLPKFDLYLGTIFWETIFLSSASVKYDTTIYSVASSNYLFVCLINIGSGTPFVSSLELRPLDGDLYDYHFKASNSISLVSVDLINFGASADPVIRYPKDAYDRVWRPRGDPSWKKLFTPLTVAVSNQFKPPSLVMQTAVAPTSGSMNFSITLDDDSRVYIYSHFAELELFGQDVSRTFNLTYSGWLFDSSVKTYYLSINTLYNTRPQYYERLDISLHMTSGSTLPPIFNAIEVYKVRESVQVSTRSEDVEAIRDIKAFYRIRKDWTGDPCAPTNFTWEGLVCTYNGPPRITALNLRASGLIGQLRISIWNLKELQKLDLSTNKLTGQIPTFLAELPHLISLNLTDSGLEGPVPKGLLDRSRNGSLELSFEKNPIPPGTSANARSANGEKKNIPRPVVESEREKKSSVIAIAIATSFSIVLLVVIVLGILWKLGSQQSSDVEYENESEEKLEVSENQNVPRNVPKDVPRNAIR